MENSTPAKRIMWKYFSTNNNKRVGRGGPKTTIYTSLCKDLKLIGRNLKTAQDLESVLTTLIAEQRGRDILCEQIICQKLRKYEQVYHPRRNIENGTETAGAIQLERDGEISTELLS